LATAPTPQALKAVLSLSCTEQKLNQQGQESAAATVAESGHCQAVNQHVLVLGFEPWLRWQEYDPFGIFVLEEVGRSCVA
jgi:hypothetical protein